MLAFEIFEKQTTTPRNVHFSGNDFEKKYFLNILVMKISAITIYFLFLAKTDCPTVHQRRDGWSCCTPAILYILVLFYI